MFIAKYLSSFNMKILTCVVLFLFSVNLMMSQGTEKKLPRLPSVSVKTTDNKTFNTSLISNEGKPVIISFWALWCKPCMKELTAISEVYEDWQQETGVKLIAVSIDDSRSSANVLPTVNGKGWSFDILLDQNGDFKRAMNVNMIPHTFIINGKGEIVWQHTSFSEGSELKLIELIRKLNKGEDISDM